MIYIDKKNEPRGLKKWKRKNNCKSYDDMPSNIKRKIRRKLLIEQGYVCCFCGSDIGIIKDEINYKICQMLPVKGKKHNIRISHIIPRKIDKSRELDYNNMCASCDSDKDKTSKKSHCDVRQKDRLLDITPLDRDCLSYFVFSLDGKIRPNPQKTIEEQAKAQDTINKLNLNIYKLKNRRSQILQDTYNWLQQYRDITSLKKLLIKDKNGHFVPFYFVPLHYYGII